ncbi:MAG: hypothetical protein M1813_002056 [Trichoglossum hirsutum]|nr:MAG: hypothetical protein M1813_002056 [Trichoglossum hirsutum]
MEPIPDSKIADQSSVCLQSFDRLSTLSRDPQSPFRDELPVSAIDDELGRFRIWAGNIGALRHGPPSLDHRLREASRVRQHILDVLYDLCFSLDEASSIVSGSRPQRKSPPSEISESFEELGAPSAASSDFGSLSTTEEQSDTGSDGASPTTEVQQLYMAVVEAVTSLFKLSMSIRSPTPLDRYAKSAKLIPLDSKYDIAHVWQKFPHARSTPWLIIRFGKAITRRRQYLRYRREHREKLGREPERKGKDEEVPEAMDKGEAMDAAEGGFVEATGGMKSVHTSSSRYLTEATPYNPPDPDITYEDTDGGESETSFASSVCEEGKGALSIPAPPEAFSDKRPFECPYCYTIQAIPDLRGTSFKISAHSSALSQNVPHDTSQAGKDGLIMSTSLTERSGLYHSGSFTQIQLPALLEKCERPIEKVAAMDCPFCDTWDAHVRRRTAAVVEGPLADVLVVTPKQFRNHVARHMVQLALFALPKQDDELGEGNIDSTAPQVVESSSDGDSALGDRGTRRVNTTHPSTVHQSVRISSNVKRSKGELALYRAAKGGEDELSAFLKGGGDADQTLLDGSTALHQAARDGDETALRLLHKLGADVDTKDGSGSSALHCAADCGHEGVARFLVERVADVDIRDKSGATALRRAVGKGHLAMIRLLLQKGADVNAKALSGATPLHRAAEKGYDAAIRLLLDNAAEIDPKDLEGHTPLYRAMGREKFQPSAQILLDKGANIETKCTKGLTPLHAAAGKGHAAATNFLLDQGADVDANGPRSMRAIHRAVYNGHKEVVSILLKHHASVNLADDDGWTPLYGAASCGHEAIARLILDQAVTDVDAQDNAGLTALHCAAAEGRIGIVKLLLERHADVSKKTKKGATVVSLAEGHHEDVADMLRQYTAVE